MKIENVEINNYRSCIKTKFPLQDTLTTLIGANGVGKTTILYAIHLLTKFDRGRRFFSEELKENLFETKIIFTLLNDDEKRIFLRATFYYDTDETNTDEIYFTEIKYRFETEPRKWTVIENEVLDFIGYQRNRQITGVPLKLKDKIYSIELLRKLFQISYYSATQFSNPSNCPISLELDERNIMRNRMRRRFPSHRMFIYDLYIASKSNEPLYELYLNTVGENGLELINNIEFYEHTIPSSSYKVKTGGKIQKIESKTTILVPSIVIDGLQLSPNQLSEGTFKTLALVFYILSDDNQLLLIEEPEISVHHGLLNSIIEIIKQYSKRKQIIISTHSDFVLDMLKPDNLLLVDKRAGKGTIASSLTKKLSQDDYSALKEYLRDTGNLGEYWKEIGFDYE